MTTSEPDGERLLKPGEVARIFGVDTKTVGTWVDAGLLTVRRTLGGHRRYKASEIRAALEAQAEPTP